MSEADRAEPPAEDPAGGPSGQPAVDPLSDPQAALHAVGQTSLRLLAGVVAKPRLEQLRKLVEQSPDAFPWQQVTRELLAEPVEPQRLMQQGLVAQRDWIARGGRTAKGPGMARRAKGFVARLVAQMVFGVIFLVIVVAGLILVRMKWDWVDIYQFVPWVKGLFGA